jgi:hypothetical protein
MCRPEDFKVKRIAFEYNIFNVFNLLKKKTKEKDIFNLFYDKVTH